MWRCSGMTSGAASSTGTPPRSASTAGRLRRPWARPWTNCSSRRKRPPPLARSCVAWPRAGRCQGRRSIQDTGPPGSSSHRHGDHLLHPLRQPEGPDSGLQCRNVDITDRKAAEDSLRLLAASVFSHAREGIMITAPNGDILDVNEAFTRSTGYAREEVLGRNPRILSLAARTGPSTPPCGGTDRQGPLVRRDLEPAQDRGRGMSPC